MSGSRRSVWKWNAKKELAALLLSEGKTWLVIEKEHGIPHSTLGDWVKCPEFQVRIDEHIEAIIAEARRILRMNARDAAKQIGNLITFGHAQHSVKLAAAKDVLDRVGLSGPVKNEHGGPNGGPLRILWIEDGSDTSDDTER